MKSWELSRNIIAYFQSFPIVDYQKCSVFSTIISKNYQVYKSYNSFDNPEIKSDPFEIVEEIIQFLSLLPYNTISIDLQTNIDYINEPRHQMLFETYILPMIKALSLHTQIREYRELDLDLFSIQGLFQHQMIIPDTVNTVIYV